MKALISPVSLEEARAVVAGGADIVDIKNVKEGSLGAQGPWVIKSVVDEFHGQGMICSAALGDLPFKPGTAALAAYGAAHCGADYLKAGLHGITNYEQALAMMEAVVRAVRMVSPDILVVACGYADFRRYGGVSYRDVVQAAIDANCDVAMLDTAIKDGKTLFDALTLDEMREFVDLAKDGGLMVALAGSVKKEHIEALVDIRPDIVGVRGAVCDGGDRTNGITRDKVEAFMAYFRSVCPERGPDLLKRQVAAANQ